jgi:hypothetical protein
MYKDESENNFRRMASITWKYRFALCGTELAIRHITQNASEIAIGAEKSDPTALTAVQALGSSYSGNALEPFLRVPG